MFGTQAVPEITLAPWVKEKSFANIELKLGMFVQGLAESLQHCIKPQISLTSLYGKFLSSEPSI